MASHLSNLECELNSKIELVFSIFEGTDFSVTNAIDVHDSWNRRLNVLSKTRAGNIVCFILRIVIKNFLKKTQQLSGPGIVPETS